MAETALAERFPEGVSGKRVHAVGAGGHGISAGVALAYARGALVTCCDVSGGAMSHLLANAGIPLTLGHDPSHVAEADLVVVSPAVTYLHPDLPELVAARERGIPVVKWQELLGLLMSSNIGVSVAGVHGKGSTTALLGLLAINAGMDPTVEVGDTVIEWDSNIHAGTGRYFINEADEWDYNFRYYHPRVVVLNAVEYDHPEFFPSYEAIRDAFVGFLRGMDTAPKPGDVPPPTIVVNADSPGCLDALRQLGDWPGQVRTFSLERADADARATEIETGGDASFTLVLGGTEVGRVRLRVPGRHNVANALAAAAAADVIGVPRETMPAALGTFRGLSRRFEIVEDGDVTFVDDYAHHPHAVAITIETARARFPGRRIVAVFQPTLYTRLHRFLAPFAEALAAADEVVVVEIQPSREMDTGLIHGSALVEAVARRPEFAARGGTVRYGGNLDETAAVLREMRRAGDVFVVMGSGPVNGVIAKARRT
ncbi:MAG TPA: UDP-N-acetylmuramate--L-alanine ligase [Ktedonobacterales bacterium]|nr:UDP-N-acetylmuramate--L-alanine ligase [Ktedonobacterales bacterium]